MKSNREPPLSLRVSEGLRRRLDDAANRAGLTRNALAVKALEAGLRAPGACPRCEHLKDWQVRARADEQHDRAVPLVENPDLGLDDFVDDQDRVEGPPEVAPWVPTMQDLLPDRPWSPAAPPPFDVEKERF